MRDQDQDNERLRWLRSFAGLNWYEETIKFIFNFVTKTSELLLAAGIVISTANFLTDGDVMSHNKSLSDAWSWAQALAIDSSLGIVFLNAFQAVREREKMKAIIFFTLTALLATVAGLITHFDALGHAAGLPVTNVSRIIPLWVMTALRAVAVIGFLLASRLKTISFNELRRELALETRPEPAQRQEPQRELTVPQIDYHALAMAIVEAMQQVETIRHIAVVEESEVQEAELPAPDTGELDDHQRSKLISLHRTSKQRELIRNMDCNGLSQRTIKIRTCAQQEPKGYPDVQSTNGNQAARANGQQKPGSTKELEPIAGAPNEKLENAYQMMQAKGSKITGETLSRRAGVRKQTALEWLRRRQEHEATSIASFPTDQQGSCVLTPLTPPGNANSCVLPGRI